MLRPRDVAASAERLRADSLELLTSLTDDELSREAVPGWSVADVFRHLAETDRTLVLGRHLLDFLPGVGDDEFERANDAALERLRDRSRDELSDELARWGRRLLTIVRLIPTPLASVRIPTLFGRVEVGWFAALRVYDEWVHQYDVLRAVGRSGPRLDPATRDLLAEFVLRALPARPLRSLERREGAVAFDLDADLPTWRFDLARRQYGPLVESVRTVTVRTDVETIVLIAADRVRWQDAERAGRLALDGDDRSSAEAVLGVVRIV
ncbi:MAG: maleylpyruvate isomerase family mycothiol-dependent enzyme [Actinobacteria bacterium]|nr:maleylpyruvate isomerase family mycothiol-dependent enzyme [Actinomycetota bacterium]